jgi:hypothetical protein
VKFINAKFKADHAAIAPNLFNAHAAGSVAFVSDDRHYVGSVNENETRRLGGRCLDEHSEVLIEISG